MTVTRTFLSLTLLPRSVSLSLSNSLYHPHLRRPFSTYRCYNQNKRQILIYCITFVPHRTNTPSVQQQQQRFLLYTLHNKQHQIDIMFYIITCLGKIINEGVIVRLAPYRNDACQHEIVVLVSCKCYYEGLVFIYLGTV